MDNLQVVEGCCMRLRIRGRLSLSPIRPETPHRAGLDLAIQVEPVEQHVCPHARRAALVSRRRVDRDRPR